MAMKQGIDCWTSLSESSTDGEGEGTLQSSHEHDEGNICIKEEGEVEKETCLSIPGSDGLRYEGQLVTQDGLVFTIKQEVDTDMFESLSSTEGQDPSTEQEMVYATIKQEDEEEIFEPITTGGEGGGETEQSIPEDLDNGQEKMRSRITACSGEKSHLSLHCSKTSTDEKCGENPCKCSHCEKVYSCRDLDNGLDKIRSRITACSGEKSHLCLHCNLDNGQDKIYSLITACSGEKSHLCLHCNNMAMKQGIDCWTSLSSTDGEGEGTLQTSHGHDEGSICIKEEGEVEKETCLSIPGSDGLRYEGQLVTEDGLVFTIKQEVDTDMFESLSSTEGQDPSNEQEMVFATIKQEDEEEIFEHITTGGEGGGETEQSIPEGSICIKEEGEVEKETCLSIPGSDGLRYEGQLVTEDGLVFTIKQEVDTDMFESLSSTEGQDPSTEQEMVYTTIKQEDEEEIFEPITTGGEGGKEIEQSIPEDLDNGQDKIHSLMAACTGEKAHLCLHCSKTFTDENWELDNGQVKVHSLITACSGERSHLCLHCSKTFTDENCGEDSYKCSHCDKVFSCQVNLTTHSRTHRGEQPYQCPSCDERFSKKTKLTRHLRPHTGEKPFQCSQCDKGFPHQSALIRHLRTHSGEKPHRCSYCERGFSQKSNLTLHLRTQTREKPFKCSQCDKRFPHVSTLIRHLGKHSGEKPHRCSYCIKRFSEKTDLTLHLKTHTGEKPFKCSQCDKRFPHLRTLIKHLETHGEKPHRCSFCNKRFSEKTDLSRHLRTHTVEKPIKCSQSDKGGTHQRTLISHLGTHSTEKPH
ncbi:zinc finger protein 502 isoform X4 [Strongylocentrotus purpuratus]|uniref:C2H2-type domain-containing protein n=1 Tax=Strongylocentrotus purpuratus TaxID=7668 RepID=A0A7M7NF41_STRPU|nr:zinc finger protein 502 isoform X4 [Strongylocentrotus purpuratus]